MEGLGATVAAAAGVFAGTLALGVRGLAAAIRSRGADRRPPPVVAAGVMAVAGITIANGADNIAVYTPLFRTIGWPDSLVTAAVFAVGIAVWCVAGAALGGHRKVVAVVQAYGHWIVPVVFVAIGLVILAGLRTGPGTGLGTGMGTGLGTGSG